MAPSAWAVAQAARLRAATPAASRAGSVKGEVSTVSLTADKPTGSGHFHGHGHSFAAADAQRGHALLAAARPKRRQQGGQDACAGRADRVTQGGRAAVDVQFGAVDAQL